MRSESNPDDVKVLCQVDAFKTNQADSRLYEFARLIPSAQQPFMPDDHSEVVPLLPIPNRTVKRLSADDSAGSRVKVGHRQALTAPKSPALSGWAFCVPRPPSPFNPLASIQIGGNSRTQPCLWKSITQRLRAARRPRPNGGDAHSKVAHAIVAP